MGRDAAWVIDNDEPLIERAGVVTLPPLLYLKPYALHHLYSSNRTARIFGSNGSGWTCACSMCGSPGRRCPSKANDQSSGQRNNSFWRHRGRRLRCCTSLAVGPLLHSGCCRTYWNKSNLVAFDHTIVTLAMAHAPPVVAMLATLNDGGASCLQPRPVPSSRMRCARSTQGVILLFHEEVHTCLSRPSNSGSAIHVR